MTALEDVICERARQQTKECFTAGHDDQWVDGELAMERTDLRFRDVPELKIEAFWMNLYYGGKWSSPQDMDVYFDNMALSFEPIGPAKSQK